jgi:glycosyltransferase involved in cell wall biosynthesis
MNLFRRRPERIAHLLKRAALRGFVGLAVDGTDVDAATANETSAPKLRSAINIASRFGERTWAERFAQRACEIGASPRARLQLASILASNGNLGEAQNWLTGASSCTDDALYHQVTAVLHAKNGRIEEAMAAFDALPGGAAGYHPAPIAFATLWEMLDQCALDHALALASGFAESYPSNLQIRSLHLRCALYAGRADLARELAQLPEYALERATMSDRRSFVEALADTLELPGRTNELLDFLADRIRKDPTHWSLYDRAANNARVASRDDDYATLIQAIPFDSRKTPEALAILCRWHVDDNRLEEARNALEELRPVCARLFLQGQLYYSLYAHADDPTRIDEAFDACRKNGLAITGPSVAYSLHKYYYDCSPPALRDCLAKLDLSAGLARTHVNFWHIYLRCLIAVGDDRRAIECYNSLPDGLAGGALLRPFSMYFQMRQGRDREARAGWISYIRVTRHLCVNAQSSYPRTLSLKYAEKPDAVLLFVTLYNAADYIDWFIAHYRALGVGHFFIIDNGSNDDTRERLLPEKDVSVFVNEESFAKSGFGVLWINHLMQRFGAGHWCFHVDVDEGFVFPDCGGTRTLRDLLSYCDERGFGLVPAVEVDMYPESVEARVYADPFAASGYFDIDYVSTPTELPPYVMIQGGIRRRLTGLALSMQKSPLVRVSPDLRFIECNHSTTHLPVADVMAALLHYKFIGDMKRRVELAISRKEHFGGAISYRRLENAVSSSGWRRSLLGPQSRRYGGPASLLRHGLIRSSGAWESGKQAALGADSQA